MKLMDRMFAVGKRRHLSPRTIACYQSWVKDFLRFHRTAGTRVNSGGGGGNSFRGWRHPRELAEREVEA